MKRSLSIFLLLLLVWTAHAQPRKKVGVVLSGGGAKGVAHVSALKAIEEAGIPIDYVVGTSMGAIVGGLYSIGYTPQQLDSMVNTQDWMYLLTDKADRRHKTFVEKVEGDKYVVTVPFRYKPQEILADGLVKGQNLHNLFSDLTIGYHDSLDFNKLPVPFACVAVDVVGMDEYVFRSGSIIEAMRSSMSIPGVFTPIRKGNMVLVDGGLVNNYPVDVAKEMGAEIIIGVDVQSDPETKATIVSLSDLVNRLTDMTGKDKYAQNLELTDLYIKVDVKGYSSASFTPEALDTLIVRGETASLAKWDDLIRLKEKIGIPEDYMPEKRKAYEFLSDENPILIRNISFEGVNSKDAVRLMEKSKVHKDTYASMKELRKAIDGLYALQTYTNISYALTENGDGYDITFALEDNTPNSIKFGLRFDTEEVAAAQINAVYQFNTPITTKAVFTGRLGKRSSARFDYYVLPSKLRYINLSYMLQYNDLNIYDRGSRQYNATYSYHLGEFGYSNILSRNFGMGLGLRYENFDYKSFLYNTEGHKEKIDKEGFFSYYATMRYDTKDRKTYPNRGTSIKADLSVYTDNLSTYDGHSPFGAASLWWESVFSPTRRFSVIPSVYGRVLFGQDSPYPYLNALGGNGFGRYMDQQMPFEGIRYVEVLPRSVVISKLQLRQRFGKKNYISLNTNYGLADDDLGYIFKGKQLFGMGIGYGYDALLGPIEASLSVSNRTNKLGFYANIGFVF